MTAWVAGAFFGGALAAGIAYALQAPIVVGLFVGMVGGIVGGFVTVAAGRAFR